MIELLTPWMNVCVRVCVPGQIKALIHYWWIQESCVGLLRRLSQQSTQIQTHSRNHIYIQADALKDSTRFRACPQTMAEKKIKIRTSNIIIPLYNPRSIFSQRDIMGLPHHRPSGPHTTDIYYFSLFNQRSVLLHSHHIGSSWYIIIDFLFKNKKTWHVFYCLIQLALWLICVILISSKNMGHSYSCNIWKAVDSMDLSMCVNASFFGIKKEKNKLFEQSSFFYF